MNVRSLTNPVIPTESVKAHESREVKADVSSEDRDANGKRDQEEPRKDPLTEEEMKKALEYLENLTSLKSNELRLEVEDTGLMRVILIKDQADQVVRRIPEWELRVLIQDKDKKTGQIFNKSA